MAPLAWVPWVPRNPSTFEQWVPEPMNFRKKGLKLTLFSFQSYGLGVWTLELAFWDPSI